MDYVRRMPSSDDGSGHVWSPRTRLYTYLVAHLYTRRPADWGCTKQSYKRQTGWTSTHCDKLSGIPMCGCNKDGIVGGAQACAAVSTPSCSCICEV